MAAREIFIVSYGMTTSVGHNAPVTAASVRANISLFNESNIVDKCGKPMLLSMAEYLDDDLKGLDRILALAVPAAKEALEPILNNQLIKNIGTIPLFIGISPVRPGFNESISGEIINRLEKETGISFTKSLIKQLPYGHASSLMGVQMAMELINSGKAGCALVGGIDSYYDPDTLEWLDETKRLHSEENKDGFIPGEGAGFCLIASIDFIRQFRLTPAAKILSAAYGEEPFPFNSDGVSIGKGLTETLHKAFKVFDNTNVKADWVVCDMNGESFRGTEWTYAYIRTGPKHADPLMIWHPADCYGDIGAASGIVLTGIAISAFKKNYGRGERCLVWVSSDDKQRAALVIEKIK